jgi:aminopeptidase C
VARQGQGVPPRRHAYAARLFSPLRQPRPDDLVCLIHCPQATTPRNTLYTIAYLGNVVGGHPVRYLNIEMDVLKAAAVAQVKDNKPVWFGCDVGKMFDRELGLMDMDLYDWESVYGVPLPSPRPSASTTAPAR